LVRRWNCSHRLSQVQRVSTQTLSILLPSQTSSGDY
jgi:hypothetical protein